MLNKYFADLHIHVGMSESGQWIKIPTSRRLTVRGILAEATGRKGMHIVGIVDALSPLALADIIQMVEEGLLTPDSGGGYRYHNNTVLILGAEIETREENGGLAHTLVFVPDIETMTAFSKCMSQYIRNINLSSQNAHMPLKKLIDIASGFGALIIPAHVFTPHKSIYGVCSKRLSTILSDREMGRLTAIELGLSADSDLADRIGELAGYTYLTNSDAHSPDKIAREYNVMKLAAPTFQEIALAFARRDNRRIEANYGLDPRLGKYHRTLCADCGFIDCAGVSSGYCSKCGSSNQVKGVYDRIKEIADFSTPCHPSHRPRYFYQIPLEFIPGLGKKSLSKLLGELKTEMNILHYASYNEICAIAGEKIAGFIINARNGMAAIVDGGGGVYGRLIKL